MSERQDRGEADGLAPVIPLFGRRGSDSPATAPVPARGDVSGHLDADSEPRWADPARDILGVEPAARQESDADREDVRSAVDLLLRRLRSRGLSEREARTYLLQQGVAAPLIDEAVDEVMRLGYVDDVALAEQLVHVATSRRGEGRVAIAQVLSRRGIPRDVADAALAEVGDDDAERALDFARRKVSSLGGRDDDTALRRLVGQLARRGYPAGVAMTAARQALSERRPPGGVRFD